MDKGKLPKDKTQKAWNTFEENFNFETKIFLNRLNVY